MDSLIFLTEPRLRFAHAQALEDPRDGLTLFGPLDQGRPYGIRYGAVGTPEGIRYLKAWVDSVQRPVIGEPMQLSRPPFPGFEATFRVPWDSLPVHEVSIPSHVLERCVLLDDPYQRVYQTVDLYTSRILDSLRQQDAAVDLWFVVVPDDVRKYCRPQGTVELGRRITSDSTMTPAYARRLLLGPSLFPEDAEAAAPYYYDVNFHHQLKARLLSYSLPTQVVRESTLAGSGKGSQRLRSSVAWNLSTATFYKSGGRPWKLEDIRDGVCYLGLVFKRDEHGASPTNACCAAQMFLDSGDGMVFRGALGPWYQPDTREFHLSQSAAKEVVRVALESYESVMGKPPRELFIHGRTRFNDAEWTGFQEATSSDTNVVGVRIWDERDFKLYRKSKHPVLRGLAMIRDERSAYLWTRGFTPRLQTYAGLEVPKPLRVDLCGGQASIEVVLADILALTKLNYNACLFGDGLPVTLRFADAVGEILTTGPMDGAVPLPFKLYI